MAANPGLVTVFGASGFLGRYVVRALTARGWRVRAAVRNPHTSHELKVIGDVGQVQLMQANVRFPKSVARAVQGCLLYTSPSPRDGLLSRMPSSA